MDADQVEVGDYTKYIVKFQVYNPTNVEGVISVNVEEGGGMFPGGPREEEDGQPNGGQTGEKLYYRTTEI